VVACVVVEVKVQQRRPDGGSIPPIARISFCSCFCAPMEAQRFFLPSEKATEQNFHDAGLGGGSCVPRLWGCVCNEPRELFYQEREKKYSRDMQRRFLPVLPIHHTLSRPLTRILIISDLWERFLTMSRGLSREFQAKDTC
jgi:hypothetical protein